MARAELIFNATIGYSFQVPFPLFRILDASEVVSPSSNSRQTAQGKLHNLPHNVLAEMIIRDDKEQNCLLLTADFSRSIYEDQATFKDGSNLDISYPMPPWIIGRKLLFNERNSLTELVEESLVVTSSQVSFRFEGDLSFEVPFSPKCFSVDKTSWLEIQPQVPSTPMNMKSFGTKLFSISSKRPDCVVNRSENPNMRFSFHTITNQYRI
jgi:hypothetical protein